MVVMLKRGCYDGRVLNMVNRKRDRVARFMRVVKSSCCVVVEIVPSVIVVCECWDLSFVLVEDVRSVCFHVRVYVCSCMYAFMCVFYSIQTNNEEASELNKRCTIRQQCQR